MPRGGARVGAGRPRGSGNTRSSRKIVYDLVERGGTPLEFLLNVMADPNETPERRFAAAAQAAPYCHPRLSAIAATVQQTIRPEELTDDQLAAIAASSSTDTADEEEGARKPH